MEAIRQLLITWMLVALFVTNSVGKNPFLRPGSTPPERTPSLPSWSDFTYNSLEEQTFWDGLPDFSDHASFEQPFYRHAKINALGELTYKNPNEGFNGYVKLKSKYFLGRIIYQYADGYRIRSKSWYLDGKEKAEENYKDLKLDGLRTEWYENGLKKTEVNYTVGKKVEAKAWKPNGEICTETNLTNGNGFIVTYYPQNGVRRLKTHYNKSIKSGLQSMWHENGQKKSEENYKYGELNGLKINWFENGQKKEEINYKDGEWHGLWTSWFENGQKKSEENYKYGTEYGLWLSWYENGKKSQKKITWKVS